jgi:hypothetical protein
MELKKSHKHQIEMQRAVRAVDHKLGMKVKKLKKFISDAAERSVGRMESVVKSIEDLESQMK